MPKKTLYLLLAAVTAFSYLLAEDLRLRSNLRSTTRITQSLRGELEDLRAENELFKNGQSSERSQLQTMSAELESLKKDKSAADELQKMLANSDKTLEAQNRKIAQLESSLKEAQEKIRRYTKTSANLEQQTRSAKANPGMTPEYVKIVENEWMSAVAKTEEMRKDLSKTLAELSGQNHERSKLRNETATMHYNLAVILTEQRNYPAAVLEYQKVLEIRPDDADSHYNLAVLYDDYVKNHDKALEHYRLYVKAAPDTPEAQKVREWIKQKEFDNTFKMKL